jgi:hypothetical protein
MSDSTPAPPAFHVLDVVEIARLGPFVTNGLAGTRGVVLSVRRYPSGSHRYSVGSLPGEPDYDEVPGIYDEEQLRPTGERAEAEPYGPVPPFRLRDVVRISDDCDVEDARGCTGYVNAAYDYGPDESPTVGVWVHDIEEPCQIDVRYLTRTGERLPAPPRERSGTATHVSTEGEITGHSEFISVDDIEHYL